MNVEDDNTKEKVDNWIKTLKELTKWAMKDKEKEEGDE
jgi:hypothetical protein